MCWHQHTHFFFEIYLGAKQKRKCNSPEVAVVVCVAMIVADPIERVFLGDVFWMLLFELFNIVPEGWDGADILGQCDREPVLEFLGLHD